MACTLFAACTLLSGCLDTPNSSQPESAGPSEKPGPGTGKLQVLATTGMIADAARNVGGDLVEVSALMGPGVDPHLYQPTARDQGRLKTAQLVLYNGLHLEGKMVEALEALGRSKPVVAVTRDIPIDKLLSWSDSAGMHDPHIWFDVQLWQTVVGTITQALSGAVPQHTVRFESQAAAYLRELKLLDAWCRSRAAQLPEDQRLLITSHDAFHYLGRAYGFEVVGLQGISTESEAGLKAITDAVDLIKQRKLRAIFPESSVQRAAIERVARDSGAALGPELYSDALGAPDSPAGTYAGMIRANFEHIVESLLGTSP